jgi:hypothetical protein
LKELIDFLQDPTGLRIFKSAYQANMKYKVDRYRTLAAEATEDVLKEKEIVQLKMPDLRRTSLAREEDNWNIFDSVSQGYRQAKDRESAFIAMKERAEQKLSGSMGVESITDGDKAKELRNELVKTLRNLSNFSSQPHIVSTVTDIVGAFLKNPNLIRTKFLNFMMLGAAGTGKTTLAKAIAHTFAKAGMFVGDKVVEAGRAEFVGEYEGQTVARTRSFLVSNLDNGVVFVDEAYALTQWNNGKPEGYGSEAVTALVEFMTKYKGLYCVITAGYEREMKRYFLTTNPGLSRRFPFKFVLEDLTADDLLLVFKRTLMSEQGMDVPTGKSADLVSEQYFSTDAWEYLKKLVEVSTGGTVEELGEEYDQATRKTYKNMREFVPNFPLMFTVFENQAGSMTNLAEEAIVVLYRTVTFKQTVKVHKESKGISRPTISLQQPQSVMRDIILERITNMAMSDKDLYFEELEQIESTL